MAKTEIMFLLEEFVKKKLVNVLLAMSAFPLVFLTVIVFVAACSDCDNSFSVEGRVAVQTALIGFATYTSHVLL